MKKLLYILLLAWGAAFGQVPDSTIAPTKPAGFVLLPAPSWGYALEGGKYVPYQYVSGLSKYDAMADRGWVRSFVAASTPAYTFGTVITSAPTPGTDAPTNAQEFFNLFYKSNPPTATLTGGTNIRISSAATTNANLTYTYGKQTGTQNIAIATINGSTTGVTQNANGATGSYTAAVPTSAFGTVSYTLLVTTADSKTASASSNYTVLNDRLWGRAVTTSPTTTEIQTAAGGSSALSASRAGSFTITASGSNRVFFAYPARLGALSAIVVGGLDQTTNYTLSTISFTNVAGYTETYNVYTSNSATNANVTMVTT